MSTSPDDPATRLASFLINGKLKDTPETSNEEVNLQDECGDSLWDEVLAGQDESLPTPESSSENKDELPNKVDKVQECDATKE